MKKMILAALVASGLSGQSAFAEVRTFDFTATIDSLERVVGTSPGPLLGGAIAKGDAITGQFSFDDEGVDWSGEAWSIKKALKLSYTFVPSGATTSVNNPHWSYTPGLPGGDLFTVGGTGGSGNIVSALFIHSPKGPFAWDLADEANGKLTVSWAGHNLVGTLGANLTSLTEVSPVPEPSTYAMLLLGAVVVGAAKRRSARRDA